MNGLVDDWMSGQGAEGEEQEQDQGARARKGNRDGFGITERIVN